MRHATLRRATLVATIAAPVASWAPRLAAQDHRPDSLAANQKASAPALPAAPVVFGSDTLFVIRSRLGPFSPAVRARAIEARMRRFADDPLVRFDSVTVVESEGASDVIAGDVVILSVTDADAAAEGRARQDLARARAEIVAAAMRGQSVWTNVKVVVLGAAFTLIATAILVLLLHVMGRMFRRIHGIIDGWRQTRIRAIRIQSMELLSADRVADIVHGLAKVVRIIFVVVLLYFYVPLVFSFFPWTRTLGTTLLGYVITPFKQSGMALVGYVPKLFTIAVVVVVTRFLLKAIHLLFRGLEVGAIRVSGFHRDWADPTYKIVRFLVLVFALIVVFPYLPGAGSDAFKGVSVFFGLLLSLGSSSAIANAVAGAVITYMRPFQIGDRVKISDTIGDVIERTLLVTRIRTIKNVDISIPNAMVLSSHIVNYSSSAAERGLILHTSVTIGYDAPWKKVHDLLLAAAYATENILRDPKAFVLQTSLDDSYVTYELNAYTDQPNLMAQTYSELHQHIQDKFNESNVEIMSPHYAAVRDGNQTTVPEMYLPKTYRARSFRILPTGDATDPGSDPRPT